MESAPMGLGEIVMTNPVVSPPPAHLRGVNLGGWLLLEKWMKPSLFDGLAASDETTWCAELGKEAGHLLTCRLRFELRETTGETVQRVRELLTRVAEAAARGAARRGRAEIPAPGTGLEWRRTAHAALRSSGEPRPPRTCLAS